MQPCINKGAKMIGLHKAVTRLTSIDQHSDNHYPNLPHLSWSALVSISMVLKSLQKVSACAAIKFTITLF